MFSFEGSHIHDQYFKSDSLNKGRTAKKIFKKLSKDMLKMAVAHGDQHVDQYNWEIDYPFWHSEQKFSWMIPVHFFNKKYLVWSEWTENNNNEADENNRVRRIDFRCSQNNVDIFIELKRIFSNLRGVVLRGDESLRLSNNRQDGLLDQVYNMVKTTGNYAENKILSGILVVHSKAPQLDYDKFNKDFNEDKMKERAGELMDAIHELIGKKKNIQLIGQHALVNWDDGDTVGFDYIPKMISIVGIFIQPLPKKDI